ncbi:MAG TPA: TolC family protein [Opitutaceae bacterium]|nr:TolC family protein [Opitutaceae bacterium]
MRARVVHPFLAGALLLIAAAPAAAREPADEFLRAIAGSPTLAAAARRVDAARARLGAAGALPDPEIEGMGSRMNGPMGERSTMYEVNLRQPLPRRGERAAERARAAAGARMAEAEFASLAGEIAAETALALAEADAADARVRLLDAQANRLEAVLHAIEVRISTGGDTRLRDRLTLQSQTASLQLMLASERRAQADALNEARGRLGLGAGDPLPAFAAPAPADVDPARAAMTRVADARAAEADATLQTARATGRPMTAVGLRFERERTGMGDEDTVGLAFSSELPWRSRRTARAETRAAEAERAAAHAEATAAGHRIATAVNRAERAERLAETSRRLSADTLGRLRAEHDALLRGASAGSPGESTVLQVADLLEKTTEAELQVVEADFAARAARAELWRHVPAEHLLADPS